MFPITQKGLSYFVSGSEKGISFVVSTTKRLYISNFGTCRDCGEPTTKRAIVFYHLLYLYNKSFTSRRIGDSSMLLFFAIGFAKLTIIFLPNLRFNLQKSIPKSRLENRLNSRQKSINIL